MTAWKSNANRWKPQKYQNRVPVNQFIKIFQIESSYCEWHRTNWCALQFSIVDHGQDFLGLRNCLSYTGYMKVLLTVTPTTPVGYYTVAGSEFCINVLIILQVQRITMVMHSILVMHKGTQLMMWVMFVFHFFFSLNRTPHSLLDVEFFPPIFLIQQFWRRRTYHWYDDCHDDCRSTLFTFTSWADWNQRIQDFMALKPTVNLRTNKQTKVKQKKKKWKSRKP